MISIYGNSSGPAIAASDPIAVKIARRSGVNTEPVLIAIWVLVQRLGSDKRQVWEYALSAKAGARFKRLRPDRGDFDILIDLSAVPLSPLPSPMTIESLKRHVGGMLPVREVAAMARAKMINSKN